MLGLILPGAIVGNVGFKRGAKIQESWSLAAPLPYDTRARARAHTRTSNRKGALSCTERKGACVCARARVCADTHPGGLACTGQRGYPHPPPGFGTPKELRHIECGRAGWAGRWRYQPCKGIRLMSTLKLRLKFHYFECMQCGVLVDQHWYTCGTLLSVMRHE